MKRLLNFMTIGTMFLFVLGCNKDEMMNSDGMDQHSLNYTLDNVPLVQNPQNVEEMLSLTDDQDDEKIGRFCYEIGLAMQELMKDAEFNHKMIALAKENAIDVVYLLDLKNDAPDYYRIINDRLAEKNLSLEYISTNMTHKPVLPHPDHPETAEIERYEPVIFIPNLPNIDPNKQPLLSPRVVTNGDKNPEYEDFILTWYYNESGVLNEILLSEATSLETTNPIFIIDNAERFAKNAIVMGGNMNNVQPPEEDNSASRAILRFDSRELKIQSGYRYETSAASEYSIMGYRIESNGTVHWVYDPSGWKVITNIPGSSIGSIVTAPSLHANNWTPYANNKFFWNTYERDWYSSAKDLGSASFGGVTIYLAERRQNTSEWYAWTPGSLQDHATPFEWFGWEPFVNFYSWKADYYVHRVDG